MRTVSMISLVGLVCSSRALFVPQKAPPKVAQSARPKAPLRCPRLSMYEVEASSGTVVACSQRKPPKEGAFGEDKVGSLGQYLSEMTSAELATALESRLSHLISAAPSASNPDAVVVALRESFYFGPRVLSLWIKPRLVLQFRKQAYPSPSIECASKCAPLLTRTPCVPTARTGYACQPPACCTHQRRRAACPGAPRTARTPHAHRPRACRTYRVPWHHRCEQDAD